MNDIGLLRLSPWQWLIVGHRTTNLKMKNPTFFITLLTVALNIIVQRSSFDCNIYLIYMLITSTQKYLHSDWLTGVQYVSYSTLNIAVRKPPRMVEVKQVEELWKTSKQKYFWNSKSTSINKMPKEIWQKISNKKLNIKNNFSFVLKFVHVWNWQLNIHSGNPPPFIWSPIILHEVSKNLQKGDVRFSVNMGSWYKGIPPLVKRDGMSECFTVFSAKLI